MPITLNIQVESAQQLRDEVRALAEAFGAQTLPALSEEHKRAIANSESNRTDDEAREKLQSERKAAGGKSSAKRATKAPSEEDASQESSSTTSDSGQTATSDASPSEAIDFEKDVAPVALKLVAERGREAMQAILEQYGVARASQIEDALLPEFLEKVKSELAA